mmetsp:Transcript_25343/g.17907  ORF Transcript_25343/g.17907 Transcript_25343/m.17907 type:complete len:261 (-) Transcript_25343:350-1132(-)
MEFLRQLQIIPDVPPGPIIPDDEKDVHPPEFVSCLGQEAARHFHDFKREMQRTFIATVSFQALFLTALIIFLLKTRDSFRSSFCKIEIVSLFGCSISDFLQSIYYLTFKSAWKDLCTFKNQVFIVIYLLCLYTATWTLLCKYFILAYKFRAILVHGIMRIDERKLITKFALVYVFTIIFGLFYLATWTEVNNLPGSRATLLYLFGAIIIIIVLLYIIFTGIWAFCIVHKSLKETEDYHISTKASALVIILIMSFLIAQIF